MKQLRSSTKRILCLLALLGLTLITAFGNRLAFSSPAQLNPEISKSRTGGETNGFCARVSLHWAHGYSGLPLVTVAIVGTSNIITSAAPATKRPHDWFEPRFSYYVITRGLPGPMELKGADGHSVAAKKGSPLSADRFPPSLRFSDLSTQQMKEGKRSLKMPLALWKPVTALPMLPLRDLFTVSKSGTYRLTVFAKVYRKSDLDGDLLNRIDLPPTSLSFEYDAAREGEQGQR